MTDERVGSCRFAYALAIFFLLVGTVSLPVSARADDSAMLLSIAGVSVTNDQFVEGFSLKTRNLRVLAICHIPAGWSMSVDGPIGPSGAIAGGASGGVAALGTRDLKELQGLFLVKKLNATDYTIEGSVDVEARGEAPDMIDIPLRSENFRLEPADHCPAQDF